MTRSECQAMVFIYVLILLVVVHRGTSVKDFSKKINAEGNVLSILSYFIYFLSYFHKK